jgi:putative hydrolase of the HAD superfamily
MTKISTVLFDLDNVLCRYDRNAHIAHIAQKAGVAPEEVNDAIWQSGFDADADAGLFDTDAYLDGFRLRIGYPLSRAEWTEGRAKTTAADHDVLKLAQALRHKTKIAILTNNTTLVTDHLDAFLPELRPLFGAHIYASAALKQRKPFAEAYRLCLARISAAPDETLFIDDSLENVTGARRAGLRGHHFKSANGLRRALKRHGLI